MFGLSEPSHSDVLRKPRAQIDARNKAPAEFLCARSLLILLHVSCRQWQLHCPFDTERHAKIAARKV